MISKKYNLLLIFYTIIIFFLILITLKDHKEQDMIEHFNYSVMKRKERRKKNSECKTKCEVKYKDSEHIKVCKNYCKCKKKCNNNKKCLKNCKNIKMNIFRDNKSKIKKMEIKEKIKDFSKKEQKEKKKEMKKKKMREELENNDEQEEKISYIDHIIDKYFNDNDKDTLLSTHISMKGFVKDLKGVLRYNNK